MKKLILTAIAAVGIIPCAGSQLIINELMQSNVYCIMDDIKEFPDSWVELYNSGETDLNLKDYKLGLKDKASKAYALPDRIIKAGEYALVYCDKTDEEEIEMHAPFRLDSGKGSLYLFDSDGNVVDGLPSLAKQPAPNVAYGRAVDGGEEWGYMVCPTPGMANTGGISDVILPEPIFDIPGGVWNQRKTLTVSLMLPEDAPEGSIIRYTMNGSEPTSESDIYEEPISFRQGTVIRAKLFCDGCISIPATTQSYIFLEREMKIPVLSIAINDSYLYDDVIGIFVVGVNENGQKNPEGKENFRYDWRRPINLELFEGQEEESVLNQICETRVQGGYTRINRLKSMAVYANKRFGTKRFEYEFWPKDKPGITDNKSFILRNGGNDFANTYVRDGLIQRVIGRNTDVDWMGYSPVVVFINGKYHAMLAVRERSNEDNIYSNYNGLEDLDMIENWTELKTGSWNNYNAFDAFLHNEHPWEEWLEWLDIEEYTNMMIINSYVINEDFPHNNIVMWRPTEDGAKWRWLIKDHDFGLGIWDTNMHKPWSDFFSHLLNNSDPTADLFKNLMKTPEYKEYFVNHMVAYMGDFLNATTFNQYLDEIIDENHGEQLISDKVWGDMWSNVEYNWMKLKDWTTQRDSYLPAQIKSYFDLGEPMDVTVNADLSDEEAALLNIKYSGVPLTKGKFKGKDYVARTLKLEPGEDDNIVGWMVQEGSGKPVEHEGSVLEMQIKNKKAIKVNAIVGIDALKGVDGHSGLKVDIFGRTISVDQFVTISDLQGRIVMQGKGRLEIASPGIYILSTSEGAVRKIVIQ